MARVVERGGMADGQKSLYSVLGLAPDAPQAVIKAAYRALAKQYHPDGAGAGDAEATQKFIELQDAYEVLSDPDRRAEYDKSHHVAAEQELSEATDEASIDPDQIWSAEAALHPEIDSIHETLNRYSPALGNRFRLAVICGECGGDPAHFAADLDRAFFRKYFGERADVQTLARRLLYAEKRRAATLLNKAVQRGKFNSDASAQRWIELFERELSPVEVQNSRRPNRSEPNQDGEARANPSDLGRKTSSIWRYTALGALAVLVLAVSQHAMFDSKRDAITPAETPKTVVEGTNSAAAEEQSLPILDRSLKQDAKYPDIPPDIVPYPDGAPSMIDAEVDATAETPEETTITKEDSGSLEPIDKSADEPRRIALVIGNANYRKISWLENPDDDARSMADVLEHLGFEVITVTNATLNDMVFALGKFTRSLRDGAEVALVYYSGHAIEVGSANYLLPVNISPLSDQDEVGEMSMSLSSLIGAMNSSKVSTKIVILDACRNNPLDSESRGGLAEVKAESGTFIAYSTAPGTVAVDGEPGARNSPYTAALVTALKSPAASIEETFRFVRLEVMRATGDKQVPWESSSLLEGFSFAAQDTGTHSKDQSNRKAPEPDPSEPASPLPDPQSETEAAQIDLSKSGGPDPSKIAIETVYMEDDEELAGISEDASVPAAKPKARPATEDRPDDEDTGPQLVAETPEGVQQGTPAPKPRPKPIEVLMEAAENMEVEPAWAPPPDQIAKPKAPPIASNAIGTVEAAKTMAELPTDPSGKTSLVDELQNGETEEVPVIRSTTTVSDGENFWWQPLILDPNKAVRRADSPEQFSDTQPAELQPNAETGETSSKSDIIITRASGAVCSHALDANRTGWDRRQQYQDDVREAKMQGLTVHSCRAALGYPPLSASPVILVPPASTEPPPLPVPPPGSDQQGSLVRAEQRVASLEPTQIVVVRQLAAWNSGALT